MFATLAGGYPGGSPTPPADRATPDRDALVREVLVEQLAAGLELLTDGLVRWDDPLEPIVRGLDGIEPDPSGERRFRVASLPAWRGPITVDAWRFAAAAPEAGGRPVKACLVGPYTLGWLARADPEGIGREQLTLALAEALNAELRALAEAGAPVVQVDEDALTRIGPADDAERSLFRDAARRLTDGVGGHLALAVTGGNADAVGPPALFDLPFASYLFDLVAGPDNWRLITQAPRERGIVCGVADARRADDDHLELMVWAAHYAASTAGRGLERVGLATSGSLAHLSRERARAKIERLAEAARIAALGSWQESVKELDPRASDIRSAAFGRYAPPRPPRRRPRPGA